MDPKGGKFFDCVVVVHHLISSKLAELGARYFRDFRVITLKETSQDRVWPKPQNRTWQYVMRSAFDSKCETPLLWWEADAVPLKPGWLTTLWEAYQEGGQPFMGHIVQKDGRIWMTGVGIYPWDTLRYCPDAMRAEAAPFDVVMSQATIGLTHRANHLIEHVWSNHPDGQTAPSFQTQADVARMVPPSAVLFHRCKDGSLIDRLSKPDTKKSALPLSFAPIPPNTKTCIVQLGRYGDIINILPVAKAIYDRDGIPPAIMVAQQYADVLEGVSYAVPYVYQGDFADINPAIVQAKKAFPDVIVSQVYGHDYTVEKHCDSFAKESWRVAGYFPQWGKLPLIFDKRNSAREAKIIKELVKTKLPVILLNLFGNSSPFSGAAELKSDIVRRWSHCCEIVDISDYQAPRIFDLLGLIERACVFVTIDTATAHLVSSNMTAMRIVLKTDKPSLWHGVGVEGIRYSEVSMRRQSIHETIFYGAITRGGFDAPRLRHVYCDYPGKGETARRNGLAAQTWQTTYAKGGWLPMPVADNQLPRLWTKDTGKKFAYFKDVIDFACGHCEPDDRIVFTNTDSCFSENIAMTIGNHKVAYFPRRDFPRLDKPLTDAQIKKGHDYCGTDMFVFTPEWWRKIRHDMPDLIIGAEGWDCLLRQLMIENGGKKVMNAIYHERHDSYWEVSQNRHAVPSQLHCVKLCYDWLTKRGIKPEDHGFKNI